ncbi:uncharacterized protein E0L32_011351 [Thyridium curvatum]|uniref:Uncharacterized protein n=1 Tax=Thyridium curvatum TaxID=1093900 RepID=A0A507BQ37_9PEZI|nr:uncharacterized protein E0L32_011351 [Thyridium curvatum]TPX18958.1 hypothetical protein E0L32_011351 [Thyridium curvatum]
MAQQSVPDNVLEAPLHFINRDKLWDTVKPYSFQYYLKEDFPRTNVKQTPIPIELKSIRDQNPPPSLDAQGFAVHELETRMQYEDFADEKTIEGIYCKELEKYFLEALGAKHVRALDYQVRRREEAFPKLKGRIPLTPQPSLITHVDVTPPAAQAIIEELYQSTSDKILQSRYQLITWVLRLSSFKSSMLRYKNAPRVWRPLRVPVKDWPLAICDATTVDRDDLIASDVLYPNFIAENHLIHHNEKQKWYWLPEQTDKEVLVFKALDTGCSTSWPCPHGAFPLPDQSSGRTLRESIDVRLLVMHAEIDYQ